MIQEFKLTEVDSGFEEKVYVIADEILHILKELSEENKQQISSKSIAEKMFWRKSVKDILHSNNVSENKSDLQDDPRLKELAETFLNKFSELVPQSMLNEISNLKDSFNADLIKNASEWLDSPISIIKKYIKSLTLKANDLEEFIVQAMQYVSETENHFTSELSSQKENFKTARNLDTKITSNMTYIKDGVQKSDDLKHIKQQLLNKIDNINKTIDEKREIDMKRLQETEQTISTMSKRMIEIKKEADDIRRRSQEIEYESVRDALTGLYNRKAYNERMSEALAHVKRYDVKSSLIICDIDYFKSINDTYGHKVGDLALKKLSSLLQERLRSNDIITRYGGEEFAVILPHTDLDGAQKAAEGIRSYIDNSVFSYKGQTIPLTISLGVSEFRKNDSEDSIFERADNALYLAKRTGRNAVKTEADVIKDGSAITSDIGVTIKE